LSGWSSLQSPANNRDTLGFVVTSPSTRPRRIFFNTFQPTFRVSQPPASRLLTRDVHQRSDLLIVEPVRCVQNDRCTFCQPNRNTATALQAHERCASRVIQRNCDCLSHVVVYGPAPVMFQYIWRIPLGVLTQNALTASDLVLIPAPAEARATNAIADLLELVHVLKGPGFDAYRILLTRLDSRKSVTNQAVMKALEPWQDKILETVIPQSEPLNQAQMARKDIFRFAPDSTGAIAYRKLIKEIKTL
jgi:hypothetical protein